MYALKDISILLSSKQVNFAAFLNSDNEEFVDVDRNTDDLSEEAEKAEMKDSGHCIFCT